MNGLFNFLMLVKGSTYLKGLPSIDLVDMHFKISQFLKEFQVEMLKEDGYVMSKGWHVGASTMAPAFEKRKTFYF